MGVVWREDPPLRTLTAAQKVLQQRWCFSEPLVARRRSVDKRLVTNGEQTRVLA